MSGKGKDQGFNKMNCRKCGRILTWFTFENEWRDGRIVARVCIRCPPAEKGE